MRHITLPGLKGITILLLILNLGYALTFGFEQMLIQRQAVGPGAAEVLTTFSYYYGIVNGQLQLRRGRRPVPGHRRRWS